MIINKHHPANNSQVKYHKQTVTIPHEATIIKGKVYVSYTLI